MSYRIRPAVKSDEPFLWQMLYYAAHMAEEDASLDSAKANPDLAYYVQDWSERDGDLGFIALASDDQPAGAAWIRIMPPNNLLSKYVTPGKPELAIAMHPEHVGRGAGAQLLQRITDTARARHPAIVLSVRSNNPALRLYQRFGFTTLALVTNRVETTSHVMELSLSS